MEKLNERPFRTKQIILLTAAFVGSVIVIQRLFRYISANLIPFDCPYYWPVSVFKFRIPSIADLATAICVCAAFFVLWKVVEKWRSGAAAAIVSGAILIAGLSLIHGVSEGFYAPVAGDAQSGTLVPYSADGQEYYHDAMKIKDPLDLLRRYNEIQPTLNRHSHTHPPGAVIVFYFLSKALQDPALISICIMIVSVWVSVFYLYRILRTELAESAASFTAFLFVLLPAVQIYYLASLDALITSLLTAVLYYFCFGRRTASAALAGMLLTLSFFLTFVSLFILPVLAGFELIMKRSLKRTSVAFGIVIVIYSLIYLLTGYDAWHSFRTASLYENPNGFMLFVDPWNYFFTRIEDIAEIIFFFGPFLMILAVRGIKGFGPQSAFRARPLFVLLTLACLSTLGMYAVGAWRTGETARACAFIYPYLLMPVGFHLEETDVGPAGRLQIAALVFFQSIAMQLFGNYFW